MKDKNLPNDYNSLSLEELTTEANKMIEELENQKDLGNSLDKYQDLIKLNNIIEKKFQKNTLMFSRFMMILTLVVGSWHQIFQYHRTAQHQ